MATILPQNTQNTKIGDNVLIGPNSTLESVTLEYNSFIGMGASVRNGAKVESYGVVAAGAVISENITVPSFQVRGLNK